MKFPFKHFAATRTHSESLILCIHDGERFGYGECAPRAYVTGETIESTAHHLNQWIKARLPIAPADDFNSQAMLRFMTTELRLLDASHANVKCAVELALTDYIEQRTDAPIQDFANTLRRHEQFTPILDGNGHWSTPISVVAAASLVKIKATDSLDELCGRIRWTRWNTEATILIDANNAWHNHQALVAVQRCIAAGAAWFEEPCDVRDYQTLRSIRRIGAKVLLDESATCIADVTIAADFDAADGINVRVAKCGGPSEAKAVAAAAKTSGLERYYGVQVAEIGTLISAGRRLALSDGSALGIEAGQSDVFFNPNQLWTQDLALDRHTGQITIPHGRRLNGRDPRCEMQPVQ